MSNAYQGNHKDCQRFIEIAWITKMSEHVTKPLNAFIGGTFGIGKTHAVETFCRNMAAALKLRFSDKLEDKDKEDVFYLANIPLHLYELAELKGLPFPNEERTAAIYLTQGLFPTKGQGVIFYDEMTLAFPSVLNNAYQLILRNCLGHYEVPKGFIQIGAGNTLADRANVVSMPFPLKNRFSHFELMVPSVEDWSEWAIANDILPLVVNFVLFSHKLFTFKPEADEDPDAMATPRTWEVVSDTLKALKEYTENDVRMIVQGCTGLGSEFVGWMEVLKDYHLADIWKVKKVDVSDQSKAGQIYALAGAIVGYYKEHMTDTDCTVLLKVADCFPKDYKVMILHQAKAYDTGFIKRCQKILPQKQYDDLLTEILKYVFV